MSCYNGERYPKEAIDSVYAQTFTDWEIIFWDNASTDRWGEYNFVGAQTHDGCKLRLLTLIDEFTRECLAIRVARRIIGLSAFYFSFAWLPDRQSISVAPKEAASPKDESGIVVMLNRGAQDGKRHIAI